MALNKTILCGRITANPELKSSPQGVSVLPFTLAVDRNYNNGGERKADFINCVAWRGTAEFIARNFSKGKMMMVVGELQTRSWDKPDGTKGYATEVIVSEAYFAGDKKEETGEPVETETLVPAFGNDDDLPF